MPFEQIITRILADLIFLVKRKQLKKNQSKFLVFTGTVGKTTLRNATAFALEKSGFRVQSSASGYTNELGIILSALGLANNFSFKKINSWKKLFASPAIDYDFILIELGADFYHDIDWFLNKFSPFAVFLSGISSEAWSGNIKEISTKRQKLLEAVPANGIIIYNSDDKEIARLISKSKIKSKTLNFSALNNAAAASIAFWTKNIFSKNLPPNEKENEQLKIKIEEIYLNFQFSRPLFVPQIYGLMAAIIFLKFLNSNRPDLSPEKIFNYYNFSQERLQIYNAENGALIIEDSYKATPLCTFWFLETCRQIKARKKILVLTEMRPLTVNAEKHYSLLVEKADFADEIYFLGPKKIFRLLGRLNQKITLITPLQYGAIAKKIKTGSSLGDAIFIKGSWRYQLSLLRNLLL